MDILKCVKIGAQIKEFLRVERNFLSTYSFLCSSILSPQCSFNITGILKYFHRILKLSATSICTLFLARGKCLYFLEYRHFVSTLPNNSFVFLVLKSDCYGVIATDAGVCVCFLGKCRFLCYSGCY